MPVALWVDSLQGRFEAVSAAQLTPLKLALVIVALPFMAWPCSTAVQGSDTAVVDTVTLPFAVNGPIGSKCQARAGLAKPTEPRPMAAIAEVKVMVLMVRILVNEWSEPAIQLQPNRFSCDCN